ncbi:MAG: glutamate formimidoyltransferase, partial [Saprospiraceae bacterium]
KVIKKENGEKVRIPGQCKSLKAIGWYIEEYGKAQVSMNLTNFKVTGIHEAFEACKSAAKKYSANITGSELIGLIPLEAMLAAGHFYANKIKTTNLTEKELIQLAVNELGLADLSTFNFEERIIEYLL